MSALVSKLEDTLSKHIEGALWALERRVGRLECLLICNDTFSPSVDEVLNQVLSKKNKNEMDALQPEAEASPEHL